jgi:hypothetical protein
VLIEKEYDHHQKGNAPCSISPPSEFCGHSFKSQAGKRFTASEAAMVADIKQLQNKIKVYEDEWYKLEATAE